MCLEKTPIIVDSQTNFCVCTECQMLLAKDACLLHKEICVDTCEFREQYAGGEWDRAAQHIDLSLINGPISGLDVVQRLSCQACSQTFANKRSWIVHHNKFHAKDPGHIVIPMQNMRQTAQGINWKCVIPTHRNHEVAPPVHDDLSTLLKSFDPLEAPVSFADSPEHALYSFQCGMQEWISQSSIQSDYLAKVTARHRPKKGEPITTKFEQLSVMLARFWYTVYHQFSLYKDTESFRQYLVSKRQASFGKHYQRLSSKAGALRYCQEFVSLFMIIYIDYLSDKRIDLTPHEIEAWKKLDQLLTSSLEDEKIITEWFNNQLTDEMKHILDDELIDDEEVDIGDTFIPAAVSIPHRTEKPFDIEELFVKHSWAIKDFQYSKKYNLAEEVEDDEIQEEDMDLVANYLGKYSEML